MVRMRNAQARRYLREVRSWLPCSGRQKREILGKIQASLQEYLQEKPDAGFADILDRFGSPREIAASYVGEMETGELLRQLKVRKRIAGIISAIMLILLVTWAGIATWEVWNHRECGQAHYSETVVEVNRVK